MARWEESTIERIALDHLIEQTESTASVSEFGCVGMERRFRATHVRDELYIVERRNVGFVDPSISMHDLFGMSGSLHSDSDDNGEFQPRFIVSVYLFNTGEASADEIYYVEDVDRDHHQEALKDPDTDSACWPLGPSGSRDPGLSPHE